jgi:hypothetical protein
MSENERKLTSVDLIIGFGSTGAFSVRDLRCANLNSTGIVRGFVERAGKNTGATFTDGARTSEVSEPTSETVTECDRADFFMGVKGRTLQAEPNTFIYALLPQIRKL